MPLYKRIWNWTLLIAIISFAVGFSIDRTRSRGPQATRNLQHSLRVYLENRLEKMRVAALSGDLTADHGRFIKATSRLQREGIECFVWKNDSLQVWTSNAIPVQELVKLEGNSLQRLSNGWILNYQPASLDTHTRLALVLPILHLYPMQNQVFRNHSAKIPGVQTAFTLEPRYFEGSLPVQMGGINPFYIRAEESEDPGAGAWLMLAGLALALVSGYFILKRVFPRENQLVVTIILASGFIMRQLFGQNLLLGSFHNLEVFQPEIYASSWYFPSFGDLLINTLLALGSINVINDLFGHRIRLLSSRKWIRWPIAATAHFAFFAVAGFLVSETAKLVVDSQIPFDFNEIYKINGYTILALFVVFLFFRILGTFCGFVAPLLFPGKKQYHAIIALLMLQAIPFLVFGLVFKNNWYLLGICFGYCLIHLATYLPFREESRISYFFIRLTAAAFALTLIFTHYIVAKEHDLRRLLASRILLRAETQTPAALEALEKQINKDIGITDYFTCEDVTKPEFEKRLRLMYLSQQAENYEIVVLDFDTAGRFYRQENPMDFRTARNLYESDLCIPVTRHFSYISDHKFKGGYIGRFPVNESQRRVGEFFILLKPRSGITQGKYSDLFRTGGWFSGNLENTYSYAIYEKGRLTRRQGEFGFPLQLADFMNDRFHVAGGFSHYYSQDEKGVVIQISKTENSINTGITIFTFLVVVSLLSVFLLYCLLWILKLLTTIRKENPTAIRLRRWLEARYNFLDSANIFLASRVQLFMVMVVFFTFVVTLYVTINYVRTTNNNRQQEFLWSRIHDMANVISNKANLEGIFGTYRHSLLYELSDYYSIDINLYNPSGMLVQTSNDRIFDEGFTGNFMHAAAYDQLKRMGKSDLVQNETLGNLHYLSAYYTLFDNDLNVKGYLNLPYFARSRELNREISNYVVALVKLFALVFALSAIVAYFLSQRIIRPLNLIRKQMGLVKLGGRNQPMDWKNNDEIGQLVHEYNKMIGQLEESLDRLADSERQGAWREMAKQVAHEIKNPLTPMKLSLQHLQYAWQRKDPEIDRKFSKTSELLIHQIDALSKMAEEFSSFAKMPEAHLEEIDLRAILNQAVHLFEREPNLRIHTRIPEQEMRVNADTDQLLRVFTNIIKNAAQAIPEQEEGRLDIAVEKVNGFVSIAFKDNGKGIEPALYDKIFSPNFSTKNSGMGLGLAISRKITESFGGSIGFNSTLGKGTTFTVKIPLYSGTA
jgi:two-component system, NtrC family, nitrogen regulation sensor histidine kinase NtrY